MKPSPLAITLATSATPPRHADLLPPHRSQSHAWGLDAYNIARPAVFLIDRNGVIHYSFIASRQNQYPSPQEVTKAIEEMLNAE